MSSPIKKLTIKGFKSLLNLEDFELKQLNVLIGPNGAGKSNFVSYFHLLRELADSRLQIWTSRQGGADRILSFGLKTTPRIESSIIFGQNGYKFILEPAADGGFYFAEEKSSEFSGIHAVHGLWYPLGTGHREANLKNDDRPVVNHCHQAISNWQIYHFHDTGDTSGMKQPCSIIDNIYLRPDASNLAAFLFRLQLENQAVYQEIRNTVSLAIPFFDDFYLRPSKINGGEEQIRLLWRQKNSDYPLWPGQLSDGSLRFICLATALLQPIPPSTIIIDEPELGLHPYAITLLGALIRAASQRMQMVISTQSIPLLNEFIMDDLIVVEREQDATVFRRLDENDFTSWLENYTIGELWEKNLLGGRP